MRVFAVSDIHIDYKENREWVAGLSSVDFVDDILIVAGDLTDKLPLMAECFSGLSKKFSQVLYVPGNHELWVTRDKTVDSFEKYRLICQLADDTGISMKPLHLPSLSVVPLLSWYDYSFGQPNQQLLDAWMDFRACIWPGDLSPLNITEYFLEKNTENLLIERSSDNHTIISFSHFLPRIDLMPSYIPRSLRYIYPVLGSNLLEKQVRILNPDMHIYGHSHVNRNVTVDGIQYINNAYGYPSEERIASKALLCIYEQ